MKREPFNPNLIQFPADDRIAGLSGPISVSRLTAMIKGAIQAALPATLHVLGEISNYKRHSGGHLYLTLKDNSSEISCVMWRSDAAKLKFAPADGLEVIATGAIEVFERTGRYQLYIRKLEPRGVGALELAFRQLREKLAAEGLFDPGRKRPLPVLPRRIVLITSPTGAAVADMLQTLARRCPCVTVLLYPVRVQGSGAADEVVTAIQKVNAHALRWGGVDVMIVGRGGGSLEDLWAFNEEIVARAIHASAIPIISAVGHETDVTIADLVADVRAATPTAAAEMAVPVQDDLLAHVVTLQSRVLRAITGQSRFLSARLAQVCAHAAIREPHSLVRHRAQKLNDLKNRARRGLEERTRQLRGVLDGLEPVVQRIAPQSYWLRTAARLRDTEHRLLWGLAGRVAGAQRSLYDRMRRLDRTSPARATPRLAERLQRLTEGLSGVIKHRLSLDGEQVRRQESMLGAMSYRSVLGRGYSITRAKKDRSVLRSPGQLRDHDRILTELAEGEVESEVVNRKQLELFG